MQEKIKCAYCSALMSKEETNIINDLFVCDKCLKEHFTQCDNCGKWFPSEERTYIYDTNEYVCNCCLEKDYEVCDNCLEYTHKNCLTETEDGCVCENCLNENYHYCWYCEEYHHEDNCYYIESVGDYVCDYCLENRFIMCDDCGEYFVRNDINEAYYGGNNVYVCDSCLSENYVYCDDCGQYYHYSDASYSEEDCCWYCDGCFHHHDTQAILSYHNYHGGYHAIGCDGSKHFGIELEVEGDNETASYVIENDYLHCEHDGSLDDGYEIISQPLSLKTWYGWKDFQELTKRLINDGVRSHDTTTCGLHIHVSREEVNNIARIKAIVELFYDDITKLARRKNNHYARFESESTSDLTEIKKACKKDNYSKYVAVNTCHSNSIEFRFFKGTLNYNTIIASIELINNIVNIANSTQTVIHLSDLIKGSYLPKYARLRGVNLNNVINLDDFINKSMLKKGGNK